LANGLTHISASTGNLSEEAIQRRYDFNHMAMIEMGDFIGALLKHIKARHKENKTVPNKLSICAGFGKLTKLADGHMDLHSRASSINFDQLTYWARKLGSTDELNNKIISANTSIEVLNLCHAEDLDLATLVCHEARLKVMSVIPDQVEVEVFAVDRKGNFVGNSNDNF
jgi:cobalt-precorrin-5B (C1)-methyltransferase